jgi:hypothetical protein
MFSVNEISSVCQPGKSIRRPNSSATANSTKVLRSGPIKCSSPPISVYYHPIIIGIIMIAAVALSLDKERVQIVK